MRYNSHVNLTEFFFKFLFFGVTDCNIKIVPHCNLEVNFYVVQIQMEHLGGQKSSGHATVSPGQKTSGL